MTERELLIYWLLRAYQSGHREGWEDGPSSAETMSGILNVLANIGYDPNLSDAAKDLVGRSPRYCVDVPAVPLAEFCEHKESCASNERYPSPPCDCGLAAALSLL
jgi:hypothetical protein